LAFVLDDFRGAQRCLRAGLDEIRQGPTVAGQVSGVGRVGGRADAGVGWEVKAPVVACLAEGARGVVQGRSRGGECGYSWPSGCGRLRRYMAGGLAPGSGGFARSDGHRFVGVWRRGGRTGVGTPGARGRSCVLWVGHSAVRGRYGGGLGTIKEGVGRLGGGGWGLGCVWGVVRWIK